MRKSILVVWEHRGVQDVTPSDLEEVDEKKLSRRTGGSVQVWRPQQNETGDWCLTIDPISLEARVPGVAFPMRFSMHNPARYVQARAVC